ncbi:hypothetical protein [Phorcysia thermohydrogeniphila]|uniref:Uncharacterized protein n=1 Tax=Phorcysia thermohydrogeniphila TaxID=936138 RepID=A0A4R1GDF8_9BACT|nr:hypothetical protein [Phorcysia thermohydrogeniphila]TCK06357.1 hypothetical protein CLV27_0158 [Phorcysia thermohydrogeniphila]
MKVMAVDFLVETGKSEEITIAQIPEGKVFLLKELHIYATPVAWIEGDNEALGLGTGSFTYSAVAVYPYDLFLRENGHSKVEILSFKRKKKIQIVDEVPHPITKTIEIATRPPAKRIFRNLDVILEGTITGLVNCYEPQEEYELVEFNEDDTLDENKLYLMVELIGEELPKCT